MRHHGAAAAAALLLILTTALQVLGDHSLGTRASDASGTVRGVNLGGWLVTEQWITPSLYGSSGADDEWSLCNELGKKRCLSTLQKHWSSFFTKDDFDDIKAAGLNAVRIPVGYWILDVWGYEPYVSGQYPYLIRAVQWARELGLSVLIDLHGAPGSQNGQDNSGLIGPVLFPTNSSNADRSLDVLRNLTQEFSRDVYGGVVTGIELLNEPRLSTNQSSYFSISELRGFYTHGASVVRSADPDKAINVTIHDAFYGPQYWADYNPNPDSTASQPAAHLTLDTHQYYAFAPLNNLTHDQILDSICNISQLLKQTSSGIPPTLVGEWSLETADSPDSTSSHKDQAHAQQAKRAWFRLLFEAQLAAYSPNGPGQSSIGWFYWTWKTEYDIDTWSYRRGVAQQYIPSDVSNASTLAFPVLANGCVDSSFDYTAPKSVGTASSIMAASGLLYWLPVVLVVGLSLAR